MNTDNAMHRNEPELPGRIQAAIDSHRIVLVVSPITDIGMITRWLSQHSEDCHRLELSMRSSVSREDFDQLRRVTGWRSLPQIFIDGKFIGGMEQFFAAVGENAATETGSQPAAPTRHPFACWLGYGGLIPFFALAVMSLFGGETLAAWATTALIAYGAVILSFVGALHWTRGLDSDNGATAARLLSISVLPALLAWLALLLPAHVGLALLAAGFALLYAWDRRAWRMRPWFLSLRSHLTAGAVGSLMIVWLTGSV